MRFLCSAYLVNRNQSVGEVIQLMALVGLSFLMCFFWYAI
mgnify:CR=1 FL=1